MVTRIETSFVIEKGDNLEEVMMATVTSLNETIEQLYWKDITVVSHDITYATDGEVVVTIMITLKDKESFNERKKYNLHRRKSIQRSRSQSKN